MITYTNSKEFLHSNKLSVANLKSYKMIKLADFYEKGI